MITVLVVGAGPTGLTLACDLARRGLSVRIIDRAPRFPDSSRGKGLQPRSLEVFDDLGVAEEILRSGTQKVVFRHYEHDQVLRDVALYGHLQPSPDVPYLTTLLIPQWRIEQILRAKLAEFGVRVELRSELTSFAHTDTGVNATIVADGRTEHVDVDYLVGCDGGKSGIRKSLGISFEGDTNATQVMLCGDVEVEGLPRDAWHQWLGDGEILLICPLPGTSAWQFQASPIDDSEPSLETFQRIVDQRTGMPIRLSNPTWLSTYRVNVRVADRLRVGRVFLAGDAAHVHPIAGGLGMNTGIQDAYNLGWKLASASERLLDTYQEERLPIAEWTLRTSSRSSAAVAAAGKDRSAGVDAGMTDDVRQLGLNYRWSSLSRDVIDRGERLQAGDRAPDGVLTTPDGQVRLFDVFRGPGFTLLGFGAGCADALAQLSDRMCTYLVTEDVAAYGIDGDTLVLVRPDGYVGLTAAGDDPDAVLDYVKTIM
ncbi:FAD-dependent monooxygenase [Kibdelosporangium philippinense]|uniref:FAD-dependent monooxygenase n=1 Tax=Kibdelosporangium philippinense TaxID=211113 RepID=A0ABS8Z943_9PSEU|nr:FAD-dependent oxidoreductase [Kibdelosporangium philippinense]MCE7004052.1 FAD-dependent monooxygenase [Kibdelosporangium philippinense]